MNSPHQLIYYNNDVWRPDSILGWRHYENANTRINAGGAGLVHFSTDSNGFRINKINNPTSPNDYNHNILVLGDSFIEGMQVENEKTIPQLLAQDLKEKKDLNVRIHNAAVGGWDPNQYLLETKKI